MSRLTSSRLTSDPLLTAARLVVIFMMVMLVIGVTAIGIGIPIVFAWRAQVLAELAADNAPAITLWAIIAVMALIAGGLMLGYRFLQQLLRIVASVGEGDPFIPANAQRLQHMGWLVLVIQIVAIPAGALAAWISTVTEKVETDVGFSANGLVLMLVLFILARVFRKGTEMRAELEGTV